MSFQQGLSGLSSSSKTLEVIGNNVANANTVGAKQAQAEFADVYARAISGGASSIGLGVSQTAVTQQFSQGSFKSTDGPLDMAINGGGFFQLKDLSGNSQYTRNGQFKVDRDGFITNTQGARLLGYPANDQGVLVPGQAQPRLMPWRSSSVATTGTPRRAAAASVATMLSERSASPGRVGTVWSCTTTVRSGRRTGRALRSSAAKACGACSSCTT